MRGTAILAIAALAVAAGFLPQRAGAHAAPLGHSTLEWRKDPNVARVSSMGFDFHGGDFFVSWRAPGRVERVDGRDCLVGGYFFFDVDDRFAFDIDETVTLELEFDRSRTDGFNVSWDHAVNPAAKSVRFAPQYEKRFGRVTVDLDRARFANRKYERMDFAIGALGAKQPQPKDVNGEFVLCDLKLVRSGSTRRPATPTGQLRLRLRDEAGQGTTARVGLYRADGWSPLPGAAALSLVPFETETKQWPLLNVPRAWPSDGRFVFYVEEAYDAPVPAGEYTLVVYKGPEYRLFTQTIVVPADAATTVDVRLQRYVDMPAGGWYSGDAHIHIARPTPGLNAGILAYTSAEDIHVSNLLQVSNVGERASYPQYAFGADGHYVRRHYSLVSGQESPRSSHRGHTIGLNAKDYVWTQEDYFVYDRIAKGVAAAGGLFGYAHVAIEAFNVHYGLATDVPLGDVAFLEVQQMGFLNTTYLYDFLNLGFRLLPAAGSDYPFIRTAGSERIYARVGRDFSPSRWFKAFEHGRSFVSNGPNLEFTVDGDADAVEFEIAKDGAVEIRATATANPDIDLVSRLELVVHGEVVGSVSAPAGAETLTLTHRLAPGESAWVALRASGVAGTAAHSAPIYLYVDGERRFWKRAAVPALAAKYLALLEEFKASSPNLDEDWERSDTEHTTGSQWQRDKKTLDQSIERAAARYRDLVREARGAE
jgi:hypothetical protein